MWICGTENVWGLFDHNESSFSSGPRDQNCTCRSLSKSLDLGFEKNLMGFLSNEKESNRKDLLYKGGLAVRDKAVDLPHHWKEAGTHTIYVDTGQ
jgi:hypothetical protein